MPCRVHSIFCFKISCHFQAKCGFFVQKINKQDSRFWNEKWNEPDTKEEIISLIKNKVFRLIDSVYILCSQKKRSLALNNWVLCTFVFCFSDFQMIFFHFFFFLIKTLWEGHKIWKNLPPVMTKQLFLLSSVKTSRVFFQIFVAFSEKLNFKWDKLGPK